MVHDEIDRGLAAAVEKVGSKESYKPF